MITANCEEELYVKLLETDTTGLFISESWFDKNQVPFENLVSCTMDGAPSMFGKHKGFIAHLKKYMSYSCIVWHII